MNQPAHLAINADDVESTRIFYERVFGWKFSAYGPPDFYKIDFGSQPARLMGALQKRKSLLKGEVTRGFECTIAVESLAQTEALIKQHGGAILMAPTTLPGVGHLLFFSDPSGNPVGAMQYDRTAD